MTSGSIQASTACEEVSNERSSILDTCALMVQEQIPNLFRLYLNPYVVQTCFCLSQYVQDAWYRSVPAPQPWQSFLANSFDEALSGAIKLARYTCNVRGRSPRGLVFDPESRLGPFASTCRHHHDIVEFVPLLRIISGDDARKDVLDRAGDDFGFVVAVAHASLSDVTAFHARSPRTPHPLTITCVDRESLGQARQQGSSDPQGSKPDIVVFDESFVDREVPFGAFTAKIELFEPWNKHGHGNFHSTTYQPNTISSLHFMRCLERADPDFHGRIAVELERIRNRPAHSVSLFGQMYNRFLAKAIVSLGFDTNSIQASGHYITCGRRRIFDGVAGVACSIRGHNPDSFVTQIEARKNQGDSYDALSTRLRELTNLDHFLPAVSGAGTVENALRLALAVQFPKRHVLAFKGGFAGKTMFSLTGTANEFYKSHLDPLYEHVTYIDPFSTTVLGDIDAALRKYPVAVVQLELIQAVGGVRPFPRAVLRHVEEHRRRQGFLLFVDEVQTGMWRTGPFIRSPESGVTPDLVSIGKGTSDMMFPFALTLYAESVQARLNAQHPDLPATIRRKFGYELGYETVLNVLRFGVESGAEARVHEAGALFGNLLSRRLKSCSAVRDLRSFGLLIGIELDTRTGMRRYLKKRLSSLYLLSMLRHPAFPLLLGWCQYEPQVLKLTPPLTVTTAEIQDICETIATVLEEPLYRLVGRGIGTMVGASVRRRFQT